MTKDINQKMRTIVKKMEEEEECGEIEMSEKRAWKRKKNGACGRWSDDVEIMR